MLHLRTCDFACISNRCSHGSRAFQSHWMVLQLQLDIETNDVTSYTHEKSELLVNATPLSLSLEATQLWYIGEKTCILWTYWFTHISVIILSYGDSHRIRLSLLTSAITAICGTNHATQSGRDLECI